MIKTLASILVILFHRSAAINQQYSPKILLNIEQLFHQIGQLHDESFLDTSYWRDNDVNLLKTASKNENKTDCSYVEDILSKNYSSGFMDINISPLLKRRANGNVRQLMRVVFQTEFFPGDFIILYKTNRENSSTNFISSNDVKKHDIFIDFNMLYDSESKYYAEYCRGSGEVIMSTRYYHEKPSWMWCMKNLIGPRILGKLFIPGTHDSGSFIRPEWWQEAFTLSKVYYGFVYTQGDSIFSQLMQGARYFDLRIGKYEDDIVFYVNHNSFKVHPLHEILQQIKEFLFYNRNEIIVIDIHRFTKGFLSQADHSELADFLKCELSDLICYLSDFPTWQVTIDEIWKTRCRIIIAYNNFPAYVLNDFYPGVNQIWGEKDELVLLINFMDTTLPRICNKTVIELTSAMAELTPTLSGIVSNKYIGLRHLASITNSLITSDFTTGSWGKAVQAVAVDFLSSTGIVNAAIRQNALRTEIGHVCH